MNRKKGFTLIELLVVIAIIGILAAITFPVFARAKVQAYRSSDITNMNSIRTALQLYRADQGGYPPALLGYVTQYQGGPNPTTQDMIPANQVAGALYPKRIDSLETLRPSYVRPSGTPLNNDFSTAVWPNGIIGGQAGSAKQRFGPNDGPVMRCGADGQTPIENYYYRISGYDAAAVPGNVTELRYTLWWSGYTVPKNPCSPDPVFESGSASDDPRQLGYSDPPETTVITWNSFFRDYSNGGLQHGKQEIVLFLSGAARPFDSVDVATKAWAVNP